MYIYIRSIYSDVQIFADEIFADDPAADPRKPRTLNPAKIKAHTVIFTHEGVKRAEGDKLAKRPRGHVITGLLQFELLLCRIITEQTRPTFLWISANAFLFGKNRRNAKACGIKSDHSMNNGAFQTGYEPKTFSAARTEH